MFLQHKLFLQRYLSEMLIVCKAVGWGSPGGLHTAKPALRRQRVRHAPAKSHVAVSPSAKRREKSKSHLLCPGVSSAGDLARVGPTHRRVPQPGRARNRQGAPPSWLMSDSKDDGGKPGVRFLARSKRGTRFRTASLLGGTKQRRRRFWMPLVGRDQGRRRCWWRSPDDRNWR